MDLGDVRVAGLGDAGCVELALFGLDTEMEAMLRRQGVPHPYVVAAFECFVFVADRGHAVKARLTEERKQDLLDQLVLTAGVEVGLKLFAALQFGG